MTDASTFFPALLFQNPDGSFSLLITGGVKLTESQAHTYPPPLDQGVSWVDPVTGRIVAGIITSDPGLLDHPKLWIEATPASDTGAVDLTLGANNRFGATLTSLTVSQSANGTASSISGLVADGSSVVILKKAKQSSFVQIVGGINNAHDQEMSRPSQANRSADLGFVPGGWATLPFNTSASDADGLLNNNGTGLELKAPSAGWYMFNLSCGFQNNTGATQEAIIGWNSAGIMLRIPGVLNTADVWLNATMHFSLAAGQVATPSAYLPGAGFGWTFRAGSIMTVQREA